MFSIVFPIDTNRLDQFRETKRRYDKMPQVKEFLLPTRSRAKVAEFLEENDLTNNVRLLPYKHEIGFNPSKALNIGLRHAKYDQIIISSPEVMPETDVLAQLETKLGKNVICQVYDQNEEGEIEMSLVNTIFRNDTPAYYFLAMFNKKDLEAINGWDEAFMEGYAYEDNDFGDRWVRAGLPFEICDEIKAIHQYHPRNETIPGGANTNYQHYQNNNNRGVIRPERGLCKE